MSDHIIDYTQEELEELYYTTLYRGIGALSHADRKKVQEYAKSHNLTIPSVEQIRQESEAVDEIDAKRGAMLIEWDNVPCPVKKFTNRADLYYQAIALRKYRKPGIVRRNLTRKQAFAVKNNILRGDYKPYSPKGSFRAYVARDPEHQSLYCVVAQYIGGSDETK